HDLGLYRSLLVAVGASALAAIGHSLDTAGEGDRKAVASHALLRLGRSILYTDLIERMSESDKRKRVADGCTDGAPCEDPQRPDTVRVGPGRRPGGGDPRTARGRLAHARGRGQRALPHHD